MPQPRRELDCQVRRRARRGSKMIPFSNMEHQRLLSFSAYSTLLFTRRHLVCGSIPVYIFHLLHLCPNVKWTKKPHQVHNQSVFKSFATFVHIFICFLAVFMLNGIFIVHVSLEKWAGRNKPCEETCQLWCPLAVAVPLFAASKMYML